MENTTEKLKTMALAKAIDCTIEEAESYIESGDYEVLDDSEADERAKDYIMESLWAFNYNFLCSHSEAISEIPEKDFQEMQWKLCEGFNKAVAAMIDDIDDLIEDAIGQDGRGHFMSSYDGEEIEEGGFYIYRNN